MSTRWHEELERSCGAGPEQRPLEETLWSGRRALRRRPVAATAAALGVVGVLGLGYAALGWGTAGQAGGLVAVDPTPSPTPNPTTSVGPRSTWEDNTPVRYVDGELLVREGVVVHDWIENPFSYDSPLVSDALDLTFEGQRQWVVISGRPGGYEYAGTVPSSEWYSFADYLGDQVEQTTGGTDGWPATVQLTGDGAVVASRGSEILQRTDRPRLGSSFAAPEVPTGAALVRAAEDGEAYFVVWRVVGGELDVLTTPPSDVVGATFDELLTYARSQYATDGGHR